VFFGSKNGPHEDHLTGAVSLLGQSHVRGDSSVDWVPRKPVKTIQKGIVKGWRVGETKKSVSKLKGISGMSVWVRAANAISSQTGREVDQPGLVGDHPNSCAGTKTGPSQRMAPMRVGRRLKRRQNVLDDRVLIQVKFLTNN
jgi:hypothetical protein